jgi:hypothetical protein
MIIEYIMLSNVIKDIFKENNIHYELNFYQYI